MGELRGGYVPGDLPADGAAEADRLLYEHVMGQDLQNRSADEQPPGDAEPGEPDNGREA